MSAIVVIAPVVIAGWPVITAAVTAAVASMGFNIVQTKAVNAVRAEARADTRTRVEMELEQSEILADAIQGQQIVVEKGGVRAIFSRDLRGALKLCVEGDHLSKVELKRIGQELIDRVTQQYVYHRVVTELKDRNMQIVEEQVGEDRTVRIKVRNV
jgi:Protein of unknown function (DUF1257)